MRILDIIQLVNNYPPPNCSEEMIDYLSCLVKHSCYNGKNLISNDDQSLMRIGAVCICCFKRWSIRLSGIQASSSRLIRNIFTHEENRIKCLEILSQSDLNNYWINLRNHFLK